MDHRQFRTIDSQRLKCIEILNEIVNKLDITFLYGLLVECFRHLVFLRKLDIDSETNLEAGEKFNQLMGEIRNKKFLKENGHLDYFDSLKQLTDPLYSYSTFEDLDSIEEEFCELIEYLKITLVDINNINDLDKVITEWLSYSIDSRYARSISCLFSLLFILRKQIVLIDIITNYLVQIDHPQAKIYKESVSDYHLLTEHLVSDGAYLPTLNPGQFDD